MYFLDLWYCCLVKKKKNLKLFGEMVNFRTEQETHLTGCREPHYSCWTKEQCPDLDVKKSKGPRSERKMLLTAETEPTWERKQVTLYWIISKKWIPACSHVNIHDKMTGKRTCGLLYRERTHSDSLDLSFYLPLSFQYQKIAGNHWRESQS